MGRLLVVVFVLYLDVVFIHASAVYLSRNISTAEGDEYQIEIESDRDLHADMMRSSVNGEKPQTIYFDRELGLEVVIPDEEQVCLFRELDEKEKTQYAIGENISGTATDVKHMKTEKVNATDEKSCAYDIEDSEDEKTNSLLRDICRDRKIIHLKAVECKDVPQNGTPSTGTWVSGLGGEEYVRLMDFIVQY